MPHEKLRCEALTDRLLQRAHRAKARDLRGLYVHPNLARIEARESLERLLELWPELRLPSEPYQQTGPALLEELERLRDAMVW